MTHNMQLEGIEQDYHVYKNSDGFMEGYKTIGKKSGQEVGSNVVRIVSNAKTLAGFGEYVRGLRKRTSINDKPLKASELPSLFPDQP